MSDTFKHHAPGEAAKSKMNELRTAFTSLEELIGYLPNSREKVLALTNLEQAAMWANKAAVKSDPDSKPE